MDSAAKTHHFEEALVFRDQLESINYVVSGWKNLNNLFEQISLPEDRQSSAISELITTLKPYLNISNINRVECFDISQMVNRHFVGSMTVWENGSLRNDQYRQFKISSKVSPDDQFMIKEVVYRRLNHPEWGAPDLIVVDGGKPQVAAANSLDTNVPIIGLAKKFETIVMKIDNEFKEVSLPKNSTALQLLQSLRDEAHRFANRYRKILMIKSINNE
jgi:excinuclease ABC subunit C